MICIKEVDETQTFSQNRLRIECNPPPFYRFHLLRRSWSPAERARRLILRRAFKAFGVLRYRCLGDMSSWIILRCGCVLSDSLFPDQSVATILSANMFRVVKMSMQLLQNFEAYIMWVGRSAHPLQKAFIMNILVIHTLLMLAIHYRSTIVVT